MPVLNRPQQFAVVGFGFGAAALYRGLPHHMPPSVAMAGRTVWLGGPMAAFLLPTAIFLIVALLRSLERRHSRLDVEASRGSSVNDAILGSFAVFVTGTHVMVLLVLLGLLRMGHWLGQVVPVMLGITMMLIGNLLPKTRPNLAIGIRTRATLLDRALWNRTHRYAGYLVVGLGTVIVLSALAVPAPAGPGMILVVAPLGVAGGWLVMRRARN